MLCRPILGSSPRMTVRGRLDRDPKSSLVGTGCPDRQRRDLANPAPPDLPEDDGAVAGGGGAVAGIGGYLATGPPPAKAPAGKPPAGTLRQRTRRGTCPSPRRRAPPPPLPN